MSDLEKIKQEDAPDNGCLFVGQPGKIAGQERCLDKEITTNNEFETFVNILAQKFHRSSYYVTPTPTPSIGSLATPPQL